MKINLMENARDKLMEWKDEDVYFRFRVVNFS